MEAWRAPALRGAPGTPRVVPSSRGARNPSASGSRPMPRLIDAPATATGERERPGRGGGYPLDVAVFCPGGAGGEGTPAKRRRKSLPERSNGPADGNCWAAREVLAMRRDSPADCDASQGLTSGAFGRSSRTRTGRRISGGRSNTEVGQCSFGGAHGQKPCPTLFTLTRVTSPPWTLTGTRPHMPRVRSGRRTVRDAPRALTTSSPSERTQAKTPPPSCRI